MKVTRLALAEFKRFRTSFELSDLQPGLNLFTGPNEAGKSTLVEAIRSAFFERHRANLTALKPWEDSSAAPTIELDFEHLGKHYHLEKRFIKKARCQLRIDDAFYEGDDAEDQLKQLLGFTQSARGASDQRDWGIPGLLWVQQGSAQDIATPVAEASDRLRSVLESMISDISSSSGDALIAEVKRRRDELLTPSAGKPRGDYDQALKASARLEEQLTQLDSDITRYRQQVDELSRLKQEQQEERHHAPAEELKQQLSQARTELERLSGLKQRIEAERHALKQLDVQLELLEERLAGYHSEQAEYATLQQQEGQCIEALDQARQQQQLANSQCERLHKARQQLRAHLLKARQQAQQHNLAQRLQQLDSDITHATQQLDKAEVLWQELTDLEQRQQVLKIDAAGVASLEQTCQALNEVTIQRRAQATQLAYQLEDGAGVSVDTTTIAGHGDIELTRAASVAIEGIGTLTITPGGNGLEQLDQRHADISQKVTDQLEALGVDTLAAAHRQLHQQRELAGDIKLKHARYKDLAPEGIDRLRQALAMKQRERADHQQQLELSHHQATSASPMLQDEVSPDLNQLDETELERRSEELEGEIQAADTQRNESTLAVTRADLDYQRHRQAIETLEKQLNAPERSERQQALQHSRNSQVNERSQRAAQLATLEAELAAAKPDLLEQDVERYQLSLAQLERRQSERRDSITRLEGELSSLGAQGLEEQRAELHSEHVHQQHRVAEFERRARALDLLLSRLNDKRQHLVQQLQQPLLAKMAHYLNILLPDARLELDDELAPTRLVRGDGHAVESGPLDDFSFGAREQLGVISRLAYADLLHEHDHPTLIILDDALVHADSQRLGSMKRVLFDAAKRHQILIFSCHPAAWQDIGVEARRITRA